MSDFSAAASTDSASLEVADAQNARDEADVARARAGDVDAFDRLMERHQTKIFNLCLWIIGDRDEAADAAQDTFIRAYRHLKKFRGDCPFGAWLGRIALNVARDALAKRKKRPRDFTSLEREDGPEFDPPDASRSAPEQLALAERQHAVRRALGQVAEPYRSTLVLYDLQGRSYEECAATLEIPVGTVKSRLSRARAALREALGDDRELFNV